MKKRTPLFPVPIANFQLQEWINHNIKMREENKAGLHQNTTLNASGVRFFLQVVTLTHLSLKRLQNKRFVVPFDLMHTVILLHPPHQLKPTAQSAGLEETLFIRMQLRLQFRMMFPWILPGDPTPHEDMIKMQQA